MSGGTFADRCTRHTFHNTEDANIALIELTRDNDYAFGRVGIARQVLIHWGPVTVAVLTS